ncbi:MAG: class I SAM-dependent methyltransferase [Chitinophagaceae bacterium]|nr:class I SAM-dependent methyltransferase [Chitinophagaceae bacterium]
MAQQPNPVQATVATFDLVAIEYDRAFTQSPIGKLQRNRVHYFLGNELTGTSLRILELNCGTGEDAIWLAGQGHNVMATDISGMMISMAEEKIKRRSLGDRIQTKQVSFNELKNVFKPESFDLVFSDFGGLNCIPEDELIDLMNVAGSLLKTGGKFIAVIMGRKCIWEQMYFLWKGKPNKASRRNKRHSITASLGKDAQPTWYYSPSEIQMIAAKKFKINKLKPVGIAIPPSYLNPFFTKKKTLLSFLNNLESIFSFSIFSNYADHFYISLRKKN